MIPKLSNCEFFELMWKKLGSVLDLVIFMTTIINKEGETVAFLYLNVILDINQQNVLGIILGNCVYGVPNKPIGKYFHDVFRKKNGKIIGKLGKKITSKKPDSEAEILFTAWKKLSKLHDHVCPWIEEKEGWTKELFVDFLAEK